MEAGGAGKIQIRRGSVIADIVVGRWTFAGSEEVKQSHLRELDLVLAGGDLNISNGSHINIIQRFNDVGGATRELILTLNRILRERSVNRLCW